MAESAPGWLSKSDYAYRNLRRMVMSGELAPGSVLAQTELAASLGMSLTPLREALKQLANEGLVEVGGYRNARITPVTAPQVRDFMEVRLALDPLAAALAAERHDADDERAIRAAAQELRPVNAHGGEEALTAHRRFHVALYRSSHNARLIRMLDGLWDESDRYRRLGLRLIPADETRVRDAREHRELMERVLARDAAGAADAMTAHVSGSIIGAVAAAGDAQAGAAQAGDADEVDATP